MSRRELSRFNQGITSFEDLRGLRAEGYVRDSTLDQKDGFGPTIQKANEGRFAHTYGAGICATAKWALLIDVFSRRVHGFCKIVMPAAIIANK